MSISSPKIKKTNSAYTKIQHRTAIAFLLPNFLGFLLFIVYPIFRALMISTTNWNGFKQMDFIGLQNYIRLFSDSTFIISLKNTLTHLYICHSSSINRFWNPYGIFNER